MEQLSQAGFGSAASPVQAEHKRMKPCGLGGEAVYGSLIVDLAGKRGNARCTVQAMQKCFPAFHLGGDAVYSSRRAAVQALSAMLHAPCRLVRSA